MFTARVCRSSRRRSRVVSRTSSVPVTRLQRLANPASAVTVADVLSGRLRPTSVPPTRRRRLVHLASAVTVADCSVAALGLTLVSPPALRSLAHRACPVAVEGMLRGRIRSVPRSIHAAATSRPPGMSGGRRGHASWPPSLHPRSTHAAATSRSRGMSGGRRGHASWPPSLHPRATHAAATSRSRACPVAVEDVLPVRLRPTPVPSARLRRLDHRAYPVAVEDVLPVHLRSTSVPSARLPSRATGLSGPGVEDGGQDKGVVPCG